MIDQKLFRQALGQFVTGIAVATTVDEKGDPHGLTINSFNSVSLDPPLVLWSLDKGSRQLDAFSNSGVYGINILSREQEPLSDVFAGPSEDRFAGIAWQKGETGAPLFGDALARIDCKVESIVEGGDHVILIGRVIEIEIGQGEPLVYHNGSYRLLAEAH